MATYGFIAPTNKFIAYAPNDVFKQEFKSEVATIKAGYLIARGTDDTKCVLSDIGTSSALAVAGYEQSFLGSDEYTSNRPASLTTAYATGAEVPALAGTNFAGCLKLAAGFNVTKGDKLAAFTDGTVVPYTPMMGGMGIKIPFEKSTTEVDTGIELPANAIVTYAMLEVTTNVASGTVDAGILSTEANGDADGFLDGASAATAGLVIPVTHAASAASLTAGALLATDIKSADGTAIFFSHFDPYVCDGTAKTVSYTTSDHAIAGNIILVVQAEGMFEVGTAEQTLSSSTSVQNVMARVNI
jgi:hypothetical protein